MLISSHSQQIDAGDLDTLDTLLPPSANERRTLADMIFAKLDEAELDNNSVKKTIKSMACDCLYDDSYSSPFLSLLVLVLAYSTH